MFKFVGHSHGISDVAWSSRSDFICSASDDQTVRVWDVMERSCVKVRARSLPAPALRAGGARARRPRHARCRACVRGCSTRAPAIDSGDAHGGTGGRFCKGIRHTCSTAPSTRNPTSSSAAPSTRPCAFGM
jgi:WD40 repeat protein